MGPSVHPCQYLTLDHTTCRSMVDKLSYCEGKLCVLQYSMLLSENKWIFTKFFHDERFVKLLNTIHIAADLC